MSARALGLLAAAAVLAGCPRHALLGAPDVADVRLPDDHGTHLAQTEWWHFHGHLTDERGGLHDFFLGFVRWHTDEDRLLFLPLRLFIDEAQQAVFSATDRGRHRYASRAKYAFPDVWAASADEHRLALRHDDWSAREEPDGMHLRASAPGTQLDLVLGQGKPLVLEGDRGRFEAPAHLFYTLPRLPARGTLTVDGEQLNVTGAGWMKHEWGYLYSDDIAGWVWFGVQLDDGSELQVGLIKDLDGRPMAGSFAEVIAPDGAVERLALDQVGVVQTGRAWTSARSGLTWPVSWRLELPARNGSLELSTPVPGQEINSFPTPLWAGGFEVQGTLDGADRHGSAMVEVLGLEQPFFRGAFHSGPPPSRKATP